MFDIFKVMDHTKTHIRRGTKVTSMKQDNEVSVMAVLQVERSEV
jgi:hypothetical protein